MHVKWKACIKVTIYVTHVNHDLSCTGAYTEIGRSTDRHIYAHPHTDHTHTYIHYKHTHTTHTHTHAHTNYSNTVLIIILTSVM